MRATSQTVAPEKLSVVSEHCLQESVRYPIAHPSVYWPTLPSTPENSSSHSSLIEPNLPAPDREMVSKPVTLTRVTNASVYLTGGRHAVHASDGTEISVHRVTPERLAEIPWRSHRHLAGTSLLLGNSAGASCYYHWMLDLLPKLGFLQRFGIELNSIDHFLVREAVTPFQIESLAKLGIDESRVVATAKKPYLSCDEVLLLSLDHQVNLTMHRFVPEWVNATFGQVNNTMAESTKRTRLYIKRPPEVRRAINNADEVETLLIGHGFECVVMEGLSIEAQAQLLGQADIVVSQHGAALTNLVFAKAGTQVIEIFGAHVYPFYFGLANLCQLEYHAVLQSADDYACLVQLETALNKGSDTNVSATQSQAFTVDLGALDIAVERVLR